jgi:hypothetical protein
MSQGGGPTGAGGGSVFRLIHKNFYKAGLPLPVQPEAFRPTNNDGDGLSVFLDGQATPEQALLAVPPEKRDLYYVARIPVRELQQLGLTLRDSPIGEAPGHAVIPEMNTQAYQQNKVAGKERQKKLAEVASANIIHRPSGGG